ncbi:MAG TPA: apolipoprotein N-acyltransferase [Casimicrobiaceae bacterium]
MTARRVLPPLLALVAGAATVFAFAPFGLGLLPYATLAVLFWQWQYAPSAKRAAWLGFAFGVGLFGAGVSWLYVAIRSFGGMPAPLAALAIACLVAYLALWPAAAGWLAARLAAPGSFARVIGAAGAFTLAEWLRGTVFTGFPWLATGYAQIPDGTLAGFAPVGGIFLVSLAVALVAALIAQAFGAIERAAQRELVLLAVAAAVLFGAGALMRTVAWTHPVGAPLAVSLVQGNVPEDDKFDPEFRKATFARYLHLVDSSRGRLVVLPESSFPMFSDEIPDDVLLSLLRTAIARDGDVLAGMFTALPPLAGSREPRVYNTVVALGASDLQFYRKHHLVPFGEAIPFESIVRPLMDSMLAIPLAGQARGSATQPPLFVAGHHVAVDICYEDAFGGEMIASAREADLLVNVTNDAWYGHSIAARQHNQIAAARALEAGRPMLRATNTGITSAIGTDGRVIAELPWFTTGVLEVSVRGYDGETPYLRAGDVPALVLSALFVALAAAAGLRRRVRGPAR